MRNVLRKPARSAPQLLVVPDRERVERALRGSLADPDAPIRALELERNQTLASGEVLELVVVVVMPAPDNGKTILARHVMPGGEPDMRELLRGAEALGQAISRHFRKYGGKWAAPVLIGF